jgi:hypothetical protein
VLGQVGLAELIRKADIHITSMPVDFDETLAYAAPDFPGQVVSLARLPQPRPAAAMHAMFAPADAAPAAPAPTPDVSNLVNFKAVPFASNSGIGMRASTNAGGLKVQTEVLVHLDSPSLSAHLKITPEAGVEEASVELTGAAGLTWKFDAGTDVGLRANVNGLLTPNIDFSIPVGGIGPVPIAVTVRQRFKIATALGVRNSTLSATGEYSFNGGYPTKDKQAT